MRTSGILQRVLEVMEENHPCRFAVIEDNNGDISPTRANIELGLTRGYSKFGDTLRLLAMAISSPRDIGESTYDNPNPKTEVE